MREVTPEPNVVIRVDLDDSDAIHQCLPQWLIAVRRSRGRQR